jgi:hemerythrin
MTKSLFDFHAEFKLGIDDMDQQHVRLMDMLNIESADESAFRAALSDCYAGIIGHIGKTDRKYAVFLHSKETL